MALDCLATLFAWTNPNSSKLQVQWAANGGAGTELCLPGPCPSFLQVLLAMFMKEGTSYTMCLGWDWSYTEPRQVKGCLLVPSGDAGKHVQASVCVLLQPPFVLVPSTDSLLASCFSQSHLTLNVLAHFYPSLKMLSHFLCLRTCPTEVCMPSNTSIISFLLKTKSYLKTHYLFFPLLYSDVLGM